MVANSSKQHRKQKTIRERSTLENLVSSCKGAISRIFAGYEKYESPKHHHIIHATPAKISKKVYKSKAQKLGSFQKNLKEEKMECEVDKKIKLLEEKVERLLHRQLIEFNGYFDEKLIPESAFFNKKEDGCEIQSRSVSPIAPFDRVITSNVIPTPPPLPPVCTPQTKAKTVLKSNPNIVNSNTPLMKTLLEEMKFIVLKPTPKVVKPEKMNYLQQALKTKFKNVEEEDETDVEEFWK